MTQNMTEMSTRPGPPPAIPDIVTPASARALFWRPRFLRSSPDLCHLPFLFWLIDLSRPRVFASLGLGDGVAYFAACQAMDRLGRDSLCHGLSADPPAAELRDHNDSEYGDISRLATGTARALAGQVTDGTVDLLALNGVPDAETIAALGDDWPRKMSARGVIVLHGVAHWPEDGPARLYLDRLGRDRPVISFEEGDGLVAVLWGADQPRQLADLAALDPMAPGAGEVRHVFRRLGSAVQTEWAARDSAARAEAAQARASAAEAALAALEATRDAAARSLGELRDSHEARAREVAVLQAKLESAEAFRDATGMADLLRRHGAAQEEMGILRARLTEAEARAADGRQAAAEARAAVEAAEQARIVAERMAADRVAAKDRALQQLGAQLAAARDQTAAREAAEEAGRRARADLLALTMQLEAGREDRDAVNRDLQALKAAHAAQRTELDAEIARLRAEADHMRAERDEARGHVAALVSSTSWKLTSPVRRLIVGLRRLRGG